MTHSLSHSLSLLVNKAGTREASLWLQTPATASMWLRGTLLPPEIRTVLSSVDIYPILCCCVASVLSAEWSLCGFRAETCANLPLVMLSLENLLVATASNGLTRNAGWGTWLSRVLVKMPSSLFPRNDASETLGLTLLGHRGGPHLSKLPSDVVMHIQLEIWSKGREAAYVQCRRCVWDFACIPMANKQQMGRTPRIFFCMTLPKGLGR